MLFLSPQNHTNQLISVKRLILIIVISLVCLFKTTFAIESTIVTESIRLNSPAIYAQENVSLGKEEGSVKVAKTPLAIINTQKHKNSEIELRPDALGSWPASGEEPGINYYYFKTPKINNKNNIYYKGNYKLEVPKELIHLLDSVTSKDSLYKLLEEYNDTYAEYTNTIIYTLKYEFKRFQREKKLESGINLVWPLAAILSLILIITYYDEEQVRHPLTLFFIVAVVMTFIHLPNILMLINGVEYSVINALGS